MFGQSWVEVAEGKATQVKENKTKTQFNIYLLPDNASGNSIYVLLPDLKKLKGDAISPLVSALFEQLKGTQLIVVLKSLYKTAYPAAADLVLPDGQLPFVTHRTSHVSAQVADYLQQKVGGPAHFIAPSGGFGAGCLVHAEMNGVAGYIATLITDSHYVSTESMIAFEPILGQIGVLSEACDVKKID